MSEKESGRILVGVDGSKNSAAALAWAIKQAEKAGDELVAVHAFHIAYYPTATAPSEDTVTQVPRGAAAYPQLIPSGGDDSSNVATEVSALKQSLRENASAAFRTRWLAPLQESRVRHRELFEEGRPGPVLLEVAAREQADLIVVGRRGLSSVTELLLGSVSHYLAHHADRPLVILPPESEEG